MAGIEGRFSDVAPVERKPASERPVYVLRIRAEPGVGKSEETHALRHALKAMLRRYRFCCLSIVPEKTPPAQG